METDPVGKNKKESMRAPYQILVFPYHIGENNQIFYCVFKRKDLDVWQGIAGGGEGDETSIEAARRESFEEARINIDSFFMKLKSTADIPVDAISGHIWGEDVDTVPEYSFGVEFDGQIAIQDEHTDYLWLPYDQAVEKLTFDSNKVALQELHKKLISNS